MRKAISAFALVLVLMAIGLMPVVMAQTQGEYVVQPGDNLWRLSGDYLGNPVKWGEVLGANPFLKEPGRQFQLPDGRIVVLIKPGEVLKGLTDLGVTAEPVPIDQLVKPAPVSADEKKAEATLLGTSWFMPLMLVLVALIVASALWLYSRIFGYPSGTPIVQGGIAAAHPDAVEERFQQIADRRLADSDPTANLATDRPTRVGPIQEGVLNGFGRVQYRGGLPQLRRLRNEPAYRARFRFQDNHEEELYFLQACANDVTMSGARYMGFTFTPGRVVIPIPTPPIPAPTDMPTGPRAIPAIAARVSAEQVLVAMGNLQFLIPAGSIFRTGENGEILLTVGGPCDIRIRQRKKAAARPKAVQKTATAE